jgi:hypothetical protein
VTTAVSAILALALVSVDQRKGFLRKKLDRLYDIEIFYAIVIEGTVRR